MEENKKIKKKGRTLGTVALIIGIISIPLFFVYYIGLVVAVVGTILSLISIPSTSEGRKDVSWISTIALAVNLLSLMGGFTILIILWFSMKQELDRTEVESMINLYNIFRMLR